jgi:hypothetical protein
MATKPCPNAGAEPLEPVQAVIETPGKGAHRCATSKQQSVTFGKPVFRNVLANGFSRYGVFSAGTFATTRFLRLERCLIVA